MTMHLTARLGPRSEQIVRDGAAKTTKKALRQALRDHPDLDLSTIATPDQPHEGSAITVGKAHDLGFRDIEVRFNGDRDLAMITFHPSGEYVIS